jgi:hypothetical protein
VRVGADETAWRIDVPGVRDATLAELEALEYSIQQEYPIEPNFRSGPEFNVYRVKGYLLRIEEMDDGDLHLTISDSPTPQQRLDRGLAVYTLVAEAPDPLCVGGRHDQVKGASRFAEQLGDVRQVLAATLPDTDDAAFLPGIPIELVGVAMMDQEKATRLTELELHPLLSVRIGDGRVTRYRVCVEPPSAPVNCRSYAMNAAIQAER